MTDIRSKPSTATAAANRASDADPARKRDAARAKADAAASKAAQAIETNPLAILAGGLALGAVAGALIPRTEREKQALAPLGRRLAAGAVAAVATAKDTGKEQITASFLSKDAAKESARRVFDSALSAAKETDKPQPGATGTPVAPTVV